MQDAHPLHTNAEHARCCHVCTRVGPLVVAASISTLVLGSVELTRKQISKAQALQLDQQGPGAAHPIM